MNKRLFSLLECQSSMENFSPFSDTKRSKQPTSESTTSFSSSSSSSVIGFPDLPSEPSITDPDRSVVLCRLCVRLPDGRRVQRNFRMTESVQLLWSFCYSQVDESERRIKRFKLIQAFPGSYKALQYGSHTSFQQSGLANSVVSMIWV